MWMEPMEEWVLLAAMAAMILAAITWTRAKKAELLALQADGCRLAGRVEEGVKDHERALALNPGNGVSRRWLAMGLVELGRHEAAMALLDPLLKEDDSQARLWAARGMSHLGLGRAREALLDLDVAVRLDAKVAMSHYQRAKALEVLERPDEAEQALKLALKLGLEGKDADEVKQRLRALQAQRPWWRRLF